MDGTVGAGGHAFGILAASSPGGLLLGLDLDPQALALSQERLAGFTGRFSLVQASFTTLLAQMKRIQWESAQGIVLDLGISSMQVDSPERGFSFHTDGPLDMRFDPGQTTTAADLVNGMTEQDLANLIWQYGEDRFSRRIAREIVQNRPFATTLQLARAIEKAVGRSKERIHPATRTFQALRIAVNQELQSIGQVLPQAIKALSPGGRLAVISFHSLEDRMVKQFFHRESRDCICPPEQPVCICGHHATIKEVTRHPIVPEEGEVKENPRARSARLRVAEKLDLA